MRTFLQTAAVLACSTTLAFAQQRTVQGVVTDTKGEAIPGATILVKGTTTGVTAGVDGKFQLGLPAGATTLVISSVGAKTQEVPIGTKTDFRVTLDADAQSLNDVVVVGYGTARKSDLTGAVASVSNAQLTQVATADPVQALQGRVAGVDITANSGQPGAGTRIRVRGVGTINNSDPLYVVDGVQTGDISFLLPTDIESTEILKDASATAIYGSRGANGVVIITTKHGKAGKTQFNLFGYTGFQEIRRQLPLTNAQQYATLVSEAYTNDNVVVPADLTPLLTSALTGGATGTDYQKLVLQKGLITNYSLSASGGTEQNRYLISGSYFQQNGIIQQSGYRKYVVRLNDDATLTKFLKAGVSATFTNSNQTGGLDANGNTGYSTVLQNAIQANPISSPYNADGSYAYNNVTSFTPNLARYLTEQQYNKTANTSLFTSSYLDVALLKNLTFRSTFGINYNNFHPKVYLPQYYLGPNDRRTQSTLIETRNENISWVWSNYFNYNKTFADNSNLSFTLGQEAQRGYGNGISVTGYDVPADATLQYISAARAANSTIRSSQYDGSLLSYFGRANYNFRDRYLVTGTLRFDQTSRFLGSNRTGVFPSVGAAWNVSNENFLKDVAAVSQVKLRASWGRVGNQNAAPNYGYASTAVNNQNYVFGADQSRAPGLAIATLSNPALKWETAETGNIGIDASFLDSKLTFTGDYFQRTTKDMIALLPVPDYLGQAPASANVGTLRNRGLELALSYRNEIGKLGYNVGVNFTKINNVITSLGGANPIASGNTQIGFTTRTDVGHEIAYFYGLQALGVFHTQDEATSYVSAGGTPIQPTAKAGDVKYQDTNGDGKIDATDNTYLGSATPSFTYGASLNLNYSNFDFKILLYGVQGAEALNAAAINLDKSSAIANIWTNFYADRMDRWTPSNPNSNQPRMTSAATTNDALSSRFVENASYLRARNMELGYSLPQTVLEKFKINGFRVFASVDNVFTVTKYRGLDPEISSSGYYGNPLAYGVDYGNYPQPRTYRLGFNVQF
ncbi:SusC/RagA family TonB-linked outer membrane protein [Hymenobacter bucti]|uniref:SusC/RagA family TonB-linked outer membrane protein n=1 Tax=Hymenobacter bucti TaxID=1844114 RepID=A0ABW4QZY2_9BACT